MKKSILLTLTLFSILALLYFNLPNETLNQYPKLSGTVLEIENFNILIDNAGSLYMVHVDNNIINQTYLNSILVGNVIEFSYNGEVAESYPMQVWAIEILKNEKPLKQE